MRLRPTQRSKVVAVILGGGEGRRLQPLTRYRAKPAVPIAGKYRLVDIPISNCINSHIRRIFLLTQFNSVSLHTHIQDTYRFDEFHTGFVRILAAQQTPSGESWYTGTADAVRRTCHYLENEDPDYILILSGDQLYRMDFNRIIEQHIHTGAGLTISTTPVPRDQAGALGIMQADRRGRILRFVEKPGDDATLDTLRAPFLEEERYLASMGIYVFSKEVLTDLLHDELMDFGRDIIPAAIGRFKVCCHTFQGYWRDIGTIGAFWQANIELTDYIPQFTFYDAEAPIYTHRRFLPPSKINRCAIERCLLSDGCIISGSRMERSIIGVRAVVGEDSVVHESVIVGADHYEEPGTEPEGLPPLGIGRGCVIERAIIDKNARIADGVRVTPEGKPEGTETDRYSIRDGLIVVRKNAILTTSD